MSEGQRDAEGEPLREREGVGVAAGEGESAEDCETEGEPVPEPLAERPSIEALVEGEGCARVAEGFAEPLGSAGDAEGDGVVEPEREGEGDAEALRRALPLCAVLCWASVGVVVWAAGTARLWHSEALGGLPAPLTDSR